MCLDCSLMNRIIYNRKDCPVCRNTNTDIIISSKLDSYENLAKEDYIYNNEIYGIKTNDGEVMHEIINMVTPRCRWCKKTFQTIKLLNEHYILKHNKTMCELCMEHEKVYANEHEVFDANELHKHCNGTNKLTGRKNHPKCEFCQIYFYDDGALENHMNEKHERCYICLKQLKTFHYFKDYNSLMNHFKKNHFLCTHKHCEHKYMAFETEEELQFHTISTHSEKRKKYSIQINYNEQEEIKSNTKSSNEQVSLNKNQFPKLVNKQTTFIKASSKPKTTSSQRRRTKIVF